MMELQAVLALQKANEFRKEDRNFVCFSFSLLRCSKYCGNSTGKSNWIFAAFARSSLLFLFCQIFLYDFLHCYAFDRKRLLKNKIRNQIIRND